MRREHIAAAAIITAAATAILFLLGRTSFGPGGEPGFWSGNIKSQFNSQFFVDPYTLTHLAHGLGFYLILWLLFPKMSVGARFVFAIGLEAGWEVLENTEFVIERYREATVAQGYFGDSVLNSFGDIVVTALGFLLAARLSLVRSIVGAFVLIEIVLALLIRDGLMLNILMLIYPVPSILMWQAGG